MRSIAHLALRELRRSWVRNVFAALAVGVGIATIIASDLISRGITEEIADSAEGKAITAFMSEQLNVGLTAIGLVITVGAGFLIFNTFAMSITQRREDFGRMRAVGNDPSPVAAHGSARSNPDGNGGNSIRPIDRCWPGAWPDAFHHGDQRCLQSLRRSLALA